MAPAPQQNSSVAALAGGLAAIGVWRLMAVAAPHLGALILMLMMALALSNDVARYAGWH